MGFLGVFWDMSRENDEIMGKDQSINILTTEKDRLKWRGLKIDKDISEAIDRATKTCLCEQIKIEWAEKLAA